VAGTAGTGVAPARRHQVTNAAQSPHRAAVFDRRQGVRCGQAGDQAARGRQDCGHSAQIDRKEPRDFDRDLYKAWHLIENFFARLKPGQPPAMTRPPQLPRRRLPRCQRRLAQLTGPNAPSAPRPAVTASTMRRHQRRRVPAAAARRSGRPPRRRFRTAPSAGARVARTAHPGRRPPPPERRLAPRG
jgi:hypothetical protein